MKKNCCIALMGAVILYVAAMSCYNTFFRASEEIPKQIVVQLGDTMWGICVDNYISKNNAETFDQFFYRNVKKNGSDIFPNQTVVITNRVWK